MTKQKKEGEITLHRGLAELKLIDAKIQKGITELVPTGLHQKDKPVNGHIPLADFNTTAESAYQSITALIARKSKIKSAIVAANAITKVKVGTVNMTIADAINLKAAMVFKKQLVETLRVKLRGSVAKLTTANEQVQSNLQSILVAALGKEQVKVGGNEVESISKPYLDINTVLLADPLKAEDKIKDLEREIEDFEADVDAALSEVNSTTFITIA